MGVCVQPIRDLTAYAHCLAKNLKDLRKIHPAPPDWKGRLIRRSNGFSVRSVKVLWRESIAELYPNAELGVSSDTTNKVTLPPPTASSPWTISDETHPQRMSAISTPPASPGEMVELGEAVLEEEASKGETLQSSPIQL